MNFNFKIINMMKIFRYFFWFLLILPAGLLQAQIGEGGMWLPNEIKVMEKDMQGMGMQLSADDIWDTTKPSLKDAVVQLGNGCTAEFVSDKGLLFTNHHCGYEAIASVSTPEHNYLDEGFWSKSFSEEIPVTGVDVTVIDNMTDVTSDILKGISEDLSPRERQSAIDKNINAYLKRFDEDEFKHYQIKPFFKGNKYYLIESTTYPDVRLVATPPKSIGKFGGDTDNWMWPRHTGDFSIFRVYAGKHNQPAEYSKDNVPYKPKRFLKINLNGVAVNDFTMVMGFPGRTNEYLTSYAIKQIMDLRDPARYKLRRKTLDILEKHMKKSEDLRLKLTTKHAHLANYWKFFIGESQGLRRFDAVGAKQKYEKEFQNRVNSRPEWQKQYGTLLDDLKKVYNEIEKYQLARDIHGEIWYRNIDLTYAYAVLRGMMSRMQSDKKFYKRNKEEYLKDIMETAYSSFDADTDKEVFAVLMQHYLDNMPPEFINPDFKDIFDKYGAETIAEKIYSESVLRDPQKVKALFDLPPKKFEKAVAGDIAFKLLYLQEMYYYEKTAAYYDLKEKLDDLMRRYMKAQLEVFPDREFSPDANFTMRVAYGRVKGFKPRDAVYYKPFTHLYGVMEKYVPGDEEFDVPLKLRELYKKRDYGRYANYDGYMVVNWLATNHITGGNSGSPVLDANGNLIGLAFDGVWEGVMEDLYYRPEIARSIMVDIRYVLFIIDKFGDDKRLIDELTITKKPAKRNFKRPERPVPPPVMEH